MAKYTLDDEARRFTTLVNAIPRLTREQELELARRYHELGDLRARDRVLESNLRHVLPYALRYGRYGMGTAELIAQGSLALVTALDRFDYKRGLRFGTYAGHWIRAEMLALTLKHRSMVGGGRGPLRAKYVFQLRRQFRGLVAKLGDREAAAQELAGRCGKSAEQVRAIMERIDSRDASLDAQAGAEASFAWSERLPSNDMALDTEVAVAEERSHLVQAVGQATADLTERERFIVQNRLMVDDDTRLSLVQVGAHFGVSRERARQLEVSLKSKLKRRLAGVSSLGMAAVS